MDPRSAVASFVRAYPAVFARRRKSGWPDRRGPLDVAKTAVPRRKVNPVTRRQTVETFPSSQRETKNATSPLRRFCSTVCAESSIGAFMVSECSRRRVPVRSPWDPRGTLPRGKPLQPGCGRRAKPFLTRDFHVLIRASQVCSSPRTTRSQVVEERLTARSAPFRHLNGGGDDYTFPESPPDPRVPARIVHRSLPRSPFLSKQLVSAIKWPPEHVNTESPAGIKEAVGGAELVIEGAVDVCRL
uniref:Uncharacterized protein n=1 Tax=Steinernema glaseri TaxID=37863 RepID=A0A1I7YDN3_9BILA